MLLPLIATLAKTSTETNEPLVRAHWNAVVTLGKQVADASKLNVLYKVCRRCIDVARMRHNIVSMYQDASKLPSLSRQCALRALVELTRVKGSAVVLGDGAEKQLQTEMEKAVVRESSSSDRSHFEAVLAWLDAEEKAAVVALKDNKEAMYGKVSSSSRIQCYRYRTRSWSCGRSHRARRRPRELMPSRVTFYYSLISARDFLHHYV